MKIKFPAGNQVPAVLARFSLIGVLATLVYWVVANVLIVADLFTPAIASVVGYLAGMGISYMGQSRVTFLIARDTLPQLVKFLFVSGVGISFSYCSVAAAVRLGIGPVWGTIAASIFIPLFSFFAMKFWVFKSND